MIRKSVFLLSIVVFFTVVAYGQKVKYKELMVLLDAKRYEEASPVLKRYLKEVKDNASAYLYMGITYQERASKNDVLKQTDILFNNIDSAIYYYTISLPMITEKDVKKNDEYYMMYSRRDYRTGEFGIKVSDIHLDIEERTKSLKARKERVKELNKYFQEAGAQYTRSNTYYKKFQNSFATKKELYLQSDDDLIKELTTLSATFDSSQVSFKNYRTTLTALGKTNYNQMVNLQEIKDFKKDGSSLADFMEDDLKLWNYTEWVTKTVRTIQDEIYPLRKEIIAFDSELNKLDKKLKSDSVAVKTDELRSNKLFTELKKWDNDPMPAALFKLKIAELDYNSALVSEATLRGNEDISKRVGLIKSQLVSLKELDSLSKVLLNRDWDKDAINYKDFITSTYGATASLKSFTKSTQQLVVRDRGLKEKELANATSLLKWVFSESDSIPLFMDVPDHSKFKPLIIQDAFTAGLNQSGPKLSGYFYSITSSRTTDLKVNFPVDSVSIIPRDLPLIKGLSLAVTNQTYFILFYSESKVEGRTPVTLAKITRSAGLEWSSFFTTGLTPVEMKFTSSTGELSIKTTSPDGDSKMIVVDKTGKRLP